MAGVVVGYHRGAWAPGLAARASFAEQSCAFLGLWAERALWSHWGSVACWQICHGYSAHRDDSRLPAMRSYFPFASTMGVSGRWQLEHNHLYTRYMLVVDTESQSIVPGPCNINSPPGRAAVLTVLCFLTQKTEERRLYFVSMNLTCKLEIS